MAHKLQVPRSLMIKAALSAVLATAFVAKSDTMDWAHSQDWGAVGAGNATCTQWKSMKQDERKEVLSWMAGFASGLHVATLFTGKQQYSREDLLKKSSSSIIESRCAQPGSGDVLMVDIAIGQFATEPLYAPKE